MFNNLAFPRSHFPPINFTREEMYELTHLVFAAYDYGKLKSALPGEFSDSDALMLADSIPKLTEMGIEELKDDITAELISSTCMIARDPSFVTRAGAERYYKLLDSAKRAVEWLLSRQKVNGSFGRYEYLRPSLGDVLDAVGYLPTCGVSVEAIISAFQPGGCCTDNPPLRPSTSPAVAPAADGQEKSEL